MGIGISMGALPFEAAMTDRATAFPYRSGWDIGTCSAEDLIVLKLFASRPLDLHDAEGVAIRQKNRLDPCFARRDMGFCLSPAATLRSFCTAPLFLGGERL